MRLALALCTVLALTACVPAGPDDAPGAMRTYRGNLVVPDPAVPGQFEVFSRAGDGPGEFWCAAGTFAARELGAAPNRRIYVVRPRGPSGSSAGRSSVVFTIAPDAAVLDAAGALPESLGMGVDRVGRNFRTAHGRQGCRPLFELSREPWGPVR